MNWQQVTARTEKNELMMVVMGKQTFMDWMGLYMPGWVRYREHYDANKHLIDTFPEDKPSFLLMNHPTNMPIIGMWAMFLYPHLEEMVECGTKISYSRRCWSSFKLFPCKAGVPASFFIFSAWKGTERK